ncbi:hypothetical protein LROSL1_2229 [Furfurilactobacillus rossiae]|uniref:hypothetical protein n=1 Tax=Furfurilactobacillus rossiae TaxID=231049 RepID=UPI0015C028F2|nr:hypothetical protein [Furfurilactobacillus rossiae]MCF6164739.1 hypothetical protein [Furfurilactobacillus rossiae]QLE65030.1 hypothetical protein LROSL1_2229 [Furfurilactobacillus rossiae]
MIKAENKRLNITITPTEWAQIEELKTTHKLSLTKLVAQLIDNAASSTSDTERHSETAK